MKRNAAATKQGCRENLSCLVYCLSGWNWVNLICLLFTLRLVIVINQMTRFLHLMQVAHRNYDEDTSISFIACCHMVVTCCTYLSVICQTTEGLSNNAKIMTFGKCSIVCTHVAEIFQTTSSLQSRSKITGSVCASLITA